MDITSLTSLPTDSLYKFMALAGLLLFILALTVPFYLRKNFFFQLYDLKKHLKKAMLRADALRSKSVNVKQSIETEKVKLEKLLEEWKEKLQQDHMQAEPLGKTAEPEWDQGKIVRLLSAVIDIELETDEQGLTIIDIECDTKKVEFLSSQLRWLLGAQFFGLALGISLTISGFYLWYWNHQVYIDAAFKSQVAQQLVEPRPNKTIQPTPKNGEK